jgi:hypothetical protein
MVSNLPDATKDTFRTISHYVPRAWVVDFKAGHNYRQKGCWTAQLATHVIATEQGH